MTGSDRSRERTTTDAHEHRPLVVGLCGSLREESKTRTALQVALDAAETGGARTRLLDLRAFDLPAFDGDVGAAGDATDLSEIVDDADSILLATPNYHGSVSGVLKNALDYLGRDEFERKTVGLVEVAGGDYPGSALRHLREIARTLNAWTLPVEVAVPSSHRTVRDGEVVDGGVESRLQTLGREAVEYACIETHGTATAVAGAQD